MTQKTLYILSAVLLLLLGVSSPLQAESPTAESNEPTESRAFVFLFDDPGPSARFQAERRDAARAVRQWLRTSAEPTDRVAVATFVHGLRPHHDLAEIAEAREPLEDAVNTAVRRAEATWTPPASSSEADDDVSFFAKLPAGDALVEKTSTLDEALVALGDAARAIDERIELVYVGPGFGEITALGDFVPDLRPRPEVIQSLREGGVAFHALDLRVPLDLEPFPTLLDDLASETDGSYIFAFESYQAMLLEIERRVRGE